MSQGSPSLTFAEAFNQFRRETQNEDRFTAGCNAFLLFDQTEDTATRLCILYNLYALYADQPLEYNPFLTFFLEFTERGSAVEQMFVQNILYGAVDEMHDLRPAEICNGSKMALLAAKTRKDSSRLAHLQSSVSRLIDDPTVQAPDADIDEQQEQDQQQHNVTDYSQHGAVLAKLTEKIQNGMDSTTLETIVNMLQEGCTRPLTVPEQQCLQKALQLYPNQVIAAFDMEPTKLPDFLEMNQILSSNFVRILLSSERSFEYLEALAHIPVSVNSLDVVYSLLTTARPPGMSDDYLHTYISNSIRTCDLLPDSAHKDKLVRLVARFLQLLLEKQIIPIAEYLIEIQSFCVDYLRFRGVAELFRLATSEAQRIGFQQHS